MSSWRISEGSPIPELMKLIKHSFRKCDYNEVENVLMEREKQTKIEMEYLVHDRDSVKEELRLLERVQCSMEQEKLKTEEKLERSLMKFQELKGTVKTLNDEKRVLNDRYLKMAEMYNNMSAHNSKMYTELVKLRKENEEYSRQKKMESDKECQVHKRQLAELAPRNMKMVELLLASGLNVKVEDLTNILAAIERLPAASASNGDDENVAVLSKKGARNLDCSKAQNIGSKELEGCSASLYKKRGHIKTKDGLAEYDECIESGHKLKKQKIIVYDVD